MVTTYSYTAKKRNAETVEGTINASSEEEAVDLINQLGLLPVSVIPFEPTKRKVKHLEKKLKSKERLVFTRQLANLLKSGVSLPKALQVLEEQSSNNYFKAVISQIKEGVKSGRSFSSCLEDYPVLFSNLYITMARAGEESSNLEEMLVHVERYQKRQEEIKSKVKMAMTYPILMGCVGIAVIYFILSFVLPKMAGLYNNMREELPMATKILFQISNILNNNGLYILAAILICVFLNRIIGVTSFGKIFSGSMMLRIPLFGDIVQKSELSRFCQALVLLLGNGVSILRALDVAVPIIGNQVLRKDFEVSVEALTKGDSFGETLKQSKWVPPLMAHTIAVGEESGNLNDVLNEIALNYEEETNEVIKIATTLLEPIMIMAIGLVIGFIIFAMLLPVFQIDILAS